jgi:tetratricopeptide (TPR) repeat protein
MISDEELLQKGKDLKEQGNGKFKAKEFEGAANLYSEAIQSLGKIKEKTKESQDLQKTCYLNLATVTNNLGRFNETIQNCNKALMLDS